MRKRYKMHFMSGHSATGARVTILGGLAAGHGSTVSANACKTAKKAWIRRGSPERCLPDFKALGQGPREEPETKLA